MVMGHGKALLQKLESTMASPVAASLQELILSNARQEAEELMRQEGLSADEATELFDYCVQNLTGNDYELTEILVSHAAHLVAHYEKKAKISGKDAPRYLVRLGRSLVQAQVFKQSEGALEFWIPGQGPVPVTRLRQLWLITEKPT
jgi:hypothetical protein